MNDKYLASSDRLLRGVQATLQKVAPLVGDEQSRAELDIIDGILSELARRNQTDVYLAYYRDQRALLVDALALLRQNLRADDAALIDAHLARELPAEIDANFSFEVIATQIRRVMRDLSTLVRTAHDDASPEIRAFIQRVVAKENEFQVQRAQFAQSRTKLDSGPAPITAERLQTYLQQRFPDRPELRVTSFRQLVGGFQKVTIFFETEDGTGKKESLVMRCEKNDKFVALDASDIRREYEIVKFLHDRGVAVAPPCWLEEDESKLGNRFLISERVPGINLGNSVSAGGLTDEITRSYMQGIARVHMIPASDEMRRLAIGHWLNYPTQEDNARANALHWRNQPWLKNANPSPILERLVTWLVDNVPRGDIPQCIIHCDYGPHNTLVHENRLTGILDWESARIGDPAEDISWFLQSFGGKVDYGKALDWYEEFTGHRISEFRIRYYDVFGCLKLMVASGSTDSMFEAHEEASVVWLNLSLRYTAFGTSQTEERIRIAEAARGK